MVFLQFVWVSRQALTIRDCYDVVMVEGREGDCSSEQTRALLTWRAKKKCKRTAALQRAFREKA